VYRRLSFLLGDPGLEKSFPDDVAGRKAWFEQLDKSLDEAGPVRFIIDLISGTSAGGINGAFLAKALVYGQPISPLRKLWLDQGDIRTLLNDKKSVEGFPSLPQPGAPESLLNSQRMYLLLFQAIGGVNPKVEASNQSPDAELPVATYVEQLDLFLTTTDIRGAELPIRLADRLVYEQRYRHNFQFIYGTKKTGSGRNDFVPTYDPMLAFAARCTSSFPFAFEPARWTDAEKLLPPPADPEEWKQLWQDWEKNFFTQYTTANDGVDNKCRAFGDGGYLDNKPFSYVTGELQSRRADYPVDRKLIYVEPSPDGSKPKSSGGKCPGKPNVLENVLAALLMLPRQETIREDIERLQERNRLLARVERIRSQLDADTTKRVTTLDTATKFGTDIGAWLQKDVTDLANEFGVAYVSYYRLKVADATDELAELVTRLFGFDPNSDTFEAVRSLARAWRDDLYKAQRPKNSEGWKSHNQFLLDFNYSYRLRKLQFLLARIATLEKTDALSRNEAATLRTLAGLDSVSAPELRKACAEMRGRFSEIYHRLRAGHRELHQEPPAAETNAPSPAPAARLSLGAQAKKLNFKPDELKA
ncbi:MAG: patatin-like protein, partial [Verrucomicrobia bacterium]